jgi:hypothetical protein
VQQVERWVLAPLRNRTFFGLDELNAAMAEKLSDLNNRPLSAGGAQTRASLFAEHEKPKLKTLPSEPFETGRWRRFKLGSDYHVCIDGVAYSAPFGLIGKPVDVALHSQPDRYLPPGRTHRLASADQAAARRAASVRHPR